MQAFLAALDERVLVCDGAMGTMLYAKGIFLNRCFDELNLTQPDLVAEVHQAYVRAGADVIETNTFGANRIKLGHFGLADEVHAINVQGARIARHAARDRRTSPARSARWASASSRGARPASTRRRSISASRRRRSLDGGVDLFMLETFRDVNEIGAAIRAVRSRLRPADRRADDDRGGRQHASTARRPRRSRRRSSAAGADVVGLNCSVGPAAMLETIERMARVATARLSAQPNAGRPRDIEGRNIYLCSPEYMALVRAALHRRPASGWSAAAAARRRITSVRSSRPCARWRRRVGLERAASAPAPCDGVAAGAPARRRSPRSRSRAWRNALARGNVRRQRRAAPAARLPGEALIEQARAAEDPRRRSRQHPRRPARDRRA